MIPVKQTKLWPEAGNCFSACVASLLEMPLEEVPCFDNDEGIEGTWLPKWQNWLKDRNLQFICLTNTGKAYTEGYAIVSSSNVGMDGCSHAFIVHGGEPVFDPHPRVRSPEDLLKDWDYWYVLVLLDPAKA